MAIGNATGFNSQFGSVDATTYSTIRKNSNTERELGRILSRSVGARKTRKILLALLGVAPGASKALTHKRVTAEQGAGKMLSNGGLRVLENAVDLTGVTTSADVTSLTNAISKTSRIASYPRDKSGFQPGKINSLIG